MGAKFSFAMIIINGNGDDDDGNGDDDIQPSVSCLNQRTLGGGKARILHAKLALVVNIV